MVTHFPQILFNRQTTNGKVKACLEEKESDTRTLRDTTGDCCTLEWWADNPNAPNHLEKQPKGGAEDPDVNDIGNLAEVQEAYVDVIFVIY